MKITALLLMLLFAISMASGGSEPKGEHWKLEVLVDYDVPQYFEDVVIFFRTEEAKRHFKARLVGDPELAEEVYVLFDLIDEDTLEQIGHDRFNQFLLEVMAGAERPKRASYEKH